MGINTINGQTLPTSSTPSTTTTPSVSLAGGTFGLVTATITKSGGGEYTNPNYEVLSKLADDTVMVANADVDRVLESDGSHLAGTLLIADTNASTALRTLSVKVQEFENSIQSAAGTATYRPVFINNAYIRVRGVDSDGDDSDDRIAITDINFYTGSGQSGTVYPTTNLTADDSEEGIVISAGHIYSTTYDAWKAVDSNTTGTLYWALSTNAANNWWQIEFETGTYDPSPTIKSMDIRFLVQNDAGYFKLTGSDSADHSSATDYGVFKITAENTVLNFG
jgi:hypothetical protein